MTKRTKEASKIVRRVSGGVAQACSGDEAKRRMERVNVGSLDRISRHVCAVGAVGKRRRFGRTGHA